MEAQDSSKKNSGAGTDQDKVLGSGESMDAIMRSLSGSGGLRLGAGTIEGVDLPDLLKTGKTSAGRTAFNAVSARFHITDGVLRNDDLVFDGPRVSATGAGTVNIGAQTLNYSLLPTAALPGAGGVKVPLRITGSWFNPRVKLDLEGIVGDKVGEKLDTLQSGAKAVEDNVKKKVEDEAKKGLRKLFD